MTTPRITGFIISLLFVSFFVGVYGMYLSSLGSKYALDYTSDMNDSVNAYNKMYDMEKKIKGYQGNVTNIGTKTGAVDVIGEFFSSATSSVMIVVNSVDIFKDMSSDASDDITDMGLGVVSEYLKVTLVSIVIVLIFIGVVLPVILKREKL